MTAPISARIDLDQLDMEHVKSREIPSGDTVYSTTAFGRFDDVVLLATDPDRLEAFAEAVLSAARDLRIVLGDPASEEFDAFPRSA